MSQTLETIKTRRSVRSYQDKPLPKNDLEQILTAGLYAPSANNTQNWQFTVVQDADKLTKLQKAVGTALGNPGYHRFYNAPVLVIVSSPVDYSHAMADCSCALENIFLAAHELGIDSVWINQLTDTYDNPEVRAVLNGFGVPENHQVCGCAALGYAVNAPAKDRENKGVIVYA